MSAKNTLSTAVAVVVAALVSALATAVLTTSAPAVEQVASKQDRVVHRTVIIRLGADGPYSHTNHIHAAVGLRSVRLAANGCDLRVIWNGRRGTEKIIAALVDEDESVSRLGVQAGYSGNIDKGTIKMYANGERVCADDPRFGTRANLWVNVSSLRVR